MHVVVDAVGIRGHGGAAVLTELLYWLPIVRPSWRWHVFLLERRLREFDDPPVSDCMTIETTVHGNGGLARLLWVNQILPNRLHTLKADILFSFANIAPARTQTPQVVFCHQPNVFFSEGIPSRALLKWARLWFLKHQILRGARASQAVIVQTEAMRERILEIEPSLDGRIHVISSGYRTPPDRRIIRQEKKVLIDSAESPRLIYVSHPGDAKNHLALIRAMALILKTSPSASLLLTLERKRPQHRQYHLWVEEIYKQAEALDVSPRIIWLGILNPDEVDYALRSSDLMVFPSLVESFGLGLVESMAAGCPVAAADLTYAHDVCGDAAVYFTPERPESIAQVVINTCTDPAVLNSLRATGSARKELFSYRNIVGEIACLLESSVQCPAKPSSPKPQQST